MATKSYRHFKEEFISLYKEGLSLRAIAEKYDIDKTSVARLVREEVPLRDKSPAHQFKDKIYELHLKGLGAYDIAHKLPRVNGKSIRGEAVKKILLKEYGVNEFVSPKYEELIPVFIKLYEEGKSLNDISKEYNLSKQTVLNYINIGGLKARDYHESSLKTYLNENYFDSLNQENAYKLGIIFSMGCVHRENTNVFLDLSIADSKNEFIFKAIENISDKNKDNLELNKNHKISTIRISSKYLCEKLINYGMGSEIKIPKEYRQSFYKGFFEVLLNVTNRNISFPTKGRYDKSVKEYLINDIGIEKDCYKSYLGTTPTITDENSIKKLLKFHPEVLEKINKKTNILKWEKFISNYK